MGWVGGWGGLGGGFGAVGAAARAAAPPAPGAGGACPPREGPRAENLSSDITFGKVASGAQRALCFSFLQRDFRIKPAHNQKRMP